jgi:pyridoxamine 5'-phosphate oxidase family protein
VEATKEVYYVFRARTGFSASATLARIATVDNDDQPTVDVVGFQFDGSRFYIGGQQLETTRKYKNMVAGQHKVSLIIDDLKSFRPWQPHGIRIHGIAEVVQRQGHLGPGSYLAITPLVSWSWGIDEPGSAQDRFGPKKIV